MSFRISGLPADKFAHLFNLDEGALAAHGARRYVVDQTPGFPDRIGLRDLEPGERALLVNYVHLDAATPYRASHAIYVCENATDTYDRTDEVPEVMRRRPLSLRAFDADHMMIDADLTEGNGIEACIARLFANPDVRYVHAHHAKRGCYAARIDRA